MGQNSGALDKKLLKIKMILRSIPECVQLFKDDDCRKKLVRTGIILIFLLVMRPLFKFFQQMFQTLKRCIVYSK